MTISQFSGKNRLKPGYGVLLILALVAAVFLMNLLLGGFMAVGLPFTYASILFWVFCVALLVLVFQRFGLVYRYDIDGVKMIISRIYLRNPRFYEQVLLREIVFVGSEEEARRRNPDASVKRAYAHRDRNGPVTAVTLRKDGEGKTFLLRLNDEAAEFLKNAVKNR